MDDAEHCILLYNLALVSFIRKRFKFSETVLNKLSEAVETSTTPALGSAVEDSAFMLKYVYPLRTAVLLARKKPLRALNVIAVYGEKAASSRVTLDKALALVQSKQYKYFKRDLKANGMAGHELTTFEFLRANLEFSRGNHRKATKLLGIGMQQHLSNGGSENASSMYSNNLGCINVMLGKANLGIFYLDRALNQHVAFMEKEGLKKDSLLRIKKAEILYNIGLALLHAGRPRQAFDILVQTIPDFANNPSLWLHLAECYVSSNRPDGSSEVSKCLYTTVPSNTSAAALAIEKSAVNTVKSIGNSQNRKLVIGKQDSEVTVIGKPDDRLTAEYANMCLKNAYQLVITQNGSEEVPPTNGSNQNSPVKASNNVSRSMLLKAAILLNRAYVSLCLSDPVTGLEQCRKLLTLDDPQSGFVLSSGYKMLCNLYMADALIQMDRIPEALIHLDPSNLACEVSFQQCPEVEEVKSDALAASKAMFQHNIIVAMLLRGELDKAEDLVEKLWATLERVPFDKYGLSANLVSLRLYVSLAKGNTEKCREICKNFCNIKVERTEPVRQES